MVRISTGVSCEALKNQRVMQRTILARFMQLLWQPGPEAPGNTCAFELWRKTQ
jgi:hypothetical protein